MSFKLRVTNMRALARIALVGAAAGMLTGCSSEVTRFMEPQAATDPTPTGTALIPAESIGQGGNMAAASAPVRPYIPSAPIQSTALPAPNPAYAVRSTPNPKLTTPSVAKMTTRVGEATSTIPARTPTGAGNWSAIGGTPVVVAKGETLSALSDRYGVPQDVLLKSNGLTASQVQPGTRMVIPVYSTGAASTVRMPVAKVETPKVVEPVRHIEPVRQVAKIEPKVEAKKESLRFTRGPESAARAEVKKIEPAKTVVATAKPVAVARPVVAATPVVAAKPVAHVETKQPEAKKVPAAKVALGKPAAAKPETKVEAKVAEKPAKPVAKQADLKVEQAAKDKLALDKANKEKAAKEAKLAADKAAKDKADKLKTAKIETAPVETKKQVADARKTDPTPTATVPKETAKEKEEPASTSDNPEFRWPARGRVIQGFKAGGNDGINISVPEGTSVKAAESGVVAYAGSELKGYGNLVLIRHPNGFVSAYAHNGEIDVKRGDTVKRGQTIAKSGQSGNVSSPQIHFELRKGSTPVDPTGYLAGL